MTYDYKREIDKWLNDLSEETIPKIWKVVVTLNSQKEILGQDEFTVPYASLKHDSIKYEGLDQETVLAILGEMHQKGIVTFYGYIETKDFANFVPPNRIIEVPFEDDGIHFGSDTQVSINKAGFEYLYLKLKEKLNPSRGKAISNQPNTLDCTWESKPNESCGILTLNHGTKFEFRSGAFGGLNAFFQNDEHTTTKEKLRESIVKYKQQAGKSANEIDISKWKYDLKKRRPDFFKHFEIESIPPDLYQLTQTSS